MTTKHKLLFTLGNNILYYRQKNKWTQKELAKKCSMYDEEIGRYERGEYIPSLSSTIKLAEAFGITIDELLHRHT